MMCKPHVMTAHDNVQLISVRCDKAYMYVDRAVRLADESAMISTHRLIDIEQDIAECITKAI